jgi:hypothetical protein
MSIGGIIGIGLWEYFTSDAYRFYLFVTISCIIVSIVVSLIHLCNIELPLDNLILLHFLMIPTLGSIYVVLWMVAAITISTQLTECVDSKVYSCNGEIVATVFGVLNLIVWMYIVVHGFHTWYRMYLMHKYTPSES